MKLRKKHLSVLRERVNGTGKFSFYHFPELVYAMSESHNEPIHINYGAYYTILVDDIGTLLVPSFPSDFPTYEGMGQGVYDEVLHALYTPTHFKYEIEGVNYVYDLDITLSVKNFRDNYRTFKTKGDWGIEYNPEPSKAIEVVKKWYLEREGEFSDVNYTFWLAKHFKELEHVHSFVVNADDIPMSFSLWGEFNDTWGIHLICKSLKGYTFLGDFTRYMTYRRMKKIGGLTYVNDGDDLGIDGIRKYKLKFRPRFIMPLYRWFK